MHNWQYLLCIYLISIFCLAQNAAIKVCFMGVGWGGKQQKQSLHPRCANKWIGAGGTVISTNISFDAPSCRNLLNKMFEVSACVIMIYNSLELMRNLLVNFF